MCPVCMCFVLSTHVHWHMCSAARVCAVYLATVSIFLPAMFHYLVYFFRLTTIRYFYLRPFFFVCIHTCTSMGMGQCCHSQGVGASLYTTFLSKLQFCPYFTMLFTVPIKQSLCKVWHVLEMVQYRWKTV